MLKRLKIRNLWGMTTTIPCTAHSGIGSQHKKSLFSLDPHLSSYYVNMKTTLRFPLPYGDSYLYPCPFRLFFFVFVFFFVGFCFLLVVVFWCLLLFLCVFCFVFCVFFLRAAFFKLVYFQYRWFNLSILVLTYQLSMWCRSWAASRPFPLELLWVAQSTALLTADTTVNNCKQ